LKGTKRLHRYACVTHERSASFTCCGAHQPQATASEAARVAQRKAELEVQGAGGKKPSTRADRVAESATLNAGGSVNDRDG
jgi:hypothetical protein